MQLLQSKWFWLGAALFFVVAIWVLNQKQANGTRHKVQVKVPQFSPVARIGQKIFEKNCMICHGKHAAGSDQGPALVHKIYETAHHSDRTFYAAAHRGVRAHHWGFGNMPPVSSVTPKEVQNIITYIRELQRANGIF